MRIGILTQPLHTNYGGLLQAYALQQALKKMGHEPYTIDLPFKKESFWDIKGLIGRVVKRYLLQKRELQILSNKPSSKNLGIISQHTDDFIKKYIQTTEKVPNAKKMHRINHYGFNAYIVGSDQVWRPRYSPNIETFFLSFLKPIDTTKKIAFAASFGVDEWEFSTKQTKVCKKLASKFDAIAVREESGVNLCNKYLNTPAVQILDPTFLVSKEEYTKITDNFGSTVTPNLFVYILDKTNDKTTIIKETEKYLDLPSTTVMPRKKYTKKESKDVTDCIFPSPSKWIEGFVNAKFVITDSFHGTAFSIIFNKPFITLANETRGLSRFTSLLKLFGLEDRLITSSTEFNIEILTKPVDYERINLIKQQEIQRSLDFLRKNLTKANIND